MSATSDHLANNAAYASGFAKGGLLLPPAKKVAVLACTDARLDPVKALGLQRGTPTVIRNAAGRHQKTHCAAWSSRSGSSAPRRSSSPITRTVGCRPPTTMPSRTRYSPTPPTPPHRFGGVSQRRGRCEADGCPDQGEPVHPPEGHLRLCLRGGERKAPRDRSRLSRIRRNARGSGYTLAGLMGWSHRTIRPLPRVKPHRWGSGRRSTADGPLAAHSSRQTAAPLGSEAGEPPYEVGLPRPS